MSHYAVRLTRSYNDCSGACLRISGVVEKMVVFQHSDASRIHVHMLLEACSVSTDTLKNYIKKELGVIGSRDWSFKTAMKVPIVTVDSQLDGGFTQYIKYMSKGNLEPLFNKGYEIDYINYCKTLWIPDNANVNANANADISGNVIRKSRMTEYDLQIMVEDLLWPGPRTPDECPFVSKDDILQATKKVLEREHKFAHFQRVSRLCQAVRWRFHPAECDAIILKMF